MIALGRSTHRPSSHHCLCFALITPISWFRSLWIWGLLPACCSVLRALFRWNIGNNGWYFLEVAKLTHFNYLSCWYLLQGSLHVILFISYFRGFFQYAHQTLRIQFHHRLQNIRVFYLLENWSYVHVTL